MSRVVSIALFLIVVLAVAPGSLVAEDFKFPYPVNRLGWVDGSGKLSLWVNGDWRVNLDNGEWLPLRFKFSSLQDRVSDGMLGAGWWVPLLESTVVQRSERSIRMTTLGGQSMYLQADSRKQGVAQTYRTQDYKWVGTVGNGGRFDVVRPDGWKFAYRGGRLARVVTPKGKALNWNYDANKRAKSITGEGGRELLTVKTGKDGLAQKITIAGGPSFDFDYGQYPQVVVANGMTTIAGIMPSVSRITEQLPGGKPGRDLGFDLKLDRGNALFQMIMETVLPDFEHSDEKNKVNAGSAKEMREFKWAVSDGSLLSDGEFAYRNEYTEDQVLRLTRIAKSGAVKSSYAYNAEKGIEIRGDKYGAVTESYRIGIPGPTYMKSRKIQRTDADGTVHQLNRAYYNDKGDLMRYKNSKGEMVSVAKVASGAVNAVENFLNSLEGTGETVVIDDRKQMVGHRRKGLNWLFEYDQNGKTTVRHCLGKFKEVMNYKDGELVKRLRFDLVTDTVSEFDAKGQLLRKAERDLSGFLRDNVREN